MKSLKILATYSKPLHYLYNTKSQYSISLSHPQYIISYLLKSDRTRFMFFVSIVKLFGRQYVLSELMKTKFCLYRSFLLPKIIIYMYKKKLNWFYNIISNLHILYSFILRKLKNQAAHQFFNHSLIRMKTNVRWPSIPANQYENLPSHDHFLKSVHVVSKARNNITLKSQHMCKYRRAIA